MRSGRGLHALDDVGHHVLQHLRRAERSEKRRNLCGSLGGARAIDCALEYPDMVRSLVLIDAQGFIDGLGPLSKLPEWLATLGDSSPSSHAAPFALEPAFPADDRPGSASGRTRLRRHWAGRRCRRTGARWDAVTWRPCA